jgi:hypothetical protein
LHAGRVTRAHDDIDAVTWRRHRKRIVSALEARGFELLASPNPETQLVLRRDGQEVSLLLVERRGADVVVPGLERWPFPQGAFGAVLSSLAGVRCRVLPLTALLHEKEHHAEWSGRPPRPKDRESIRVVRALLERPSGSGLGTARR